MLTRAPFALILAALVAGAAAAAEYTATVVDRQGNRFEVSRLTYQDTGQLEVWVDGQRRLIGLAEADRLRLEGDPRDEELTILINLRTGEVLRGTIYSGGASVVPHGDAVGGAQPLQRFTGVTALGPFLVRLSDIQEIILHHTDPAAAAPVLDATIVTVDGVRLEVSDLRYRNRTRFTYEQGRKQVSQDMERIERIEVGQTAHNAEVRPVTIRFRSGKVARGTVDASTVRLSGETDRNYADRVHGAFSGRAESGQIMLGLHEVKLILFADPQEAEATADSASGQP